MVEMLERQMENDELVRPCQAHLRLGVGCYVPSFQGF